MFDLVSSQAVPSKFLTPIRRGTETDFEWGGLALQDNTGGLYQILWEAYYRDNTIRLRSKTHEYIIVSGIPQPDHLSIAFDVNMNYNCTYIIDGTLYWKWYDTTILGHVTTPIPNVTSAYCTLDDARPNADDWNDVILIYIRDHVMYYRLQRDRYTVEYEFAELPNRKIMQAGMTTGHRLQVRHSYDPQLAKENSE